MEIVAGGDVSRALNVYSSDPQNINVRRHKPSSSGFQSEEKVELSDVGVALEKSLIEMDEVAEVNTEKVTQLRKSMADDQYTPNLEKLASNMLLEADIQEMLF